MTGGLIGVRFQFFSVAKPMGNLKSPRLILTRQIQPATRIQRKCTLGAPSLSCRRLPFWSARVERLGVRWGQPPVVFPTGNIFM